MRKVLDFVYKVLITAITVLFIVIFLMITAEIICRTFLGFSILWMTDFVILCVVWMLCLGMAAGIYKSEHLRVDFLLDKMPPRVAQGFRVFTSVLAMVFFILMVPAGYQIAMLRMQIEFTTLRWPTGYAFMALPVFAAIAAVYMGFRVFMAVQLARGIDVAPVEGLTEDEEFNYEEL